MIPIAILASGRGSNFEAIQKAIDSQDLKAEVQVVISDQPEAPVLAKARKMGIQAISIPFSQAGSLQERRAEHEAKLLKQLEKFSPKFLVLAGYRRIVTPQLIESFRCDKGYSRMVNIHPSLLPAFPGLHSYAQAFRYGAKVAGVTVHLVEAQVDSGPICAQEAFSIADCRSEEQVEHRGLEIEHRLLPKTLSWILPERFEVERRSLAGAEGRLCVSAN